MSGLSRFLFGRSRVQQALDEQRQAAAHALAEKDAALAALFETGTAGISEVDLACGRFVRVNRRFCEIMRREADLLLTLGPGDVIHPDDRDAVKAQWMAAMKIGGAWEAEVRHIAPDGEAFWVRIGVSVWKRNDAGVPVRCIAVLQDVTDERQGEGASAVQRATAAARSAGRPHRQLQPRSPHRTGAMRRRDLAYVRSAAGRRAVLLETWFNGFLGGPGACVACDRRGARAPRWEIAIDYRVRRRPDGSVRHLEMRARYFYDDEGRPLRSVGVVIDVTERREAEERLAYAARHDALTGLANRVLFRERVNAAQRLGRGESLPCFASISIASRTSTTRWVIRWATGCSPKSRRDCSRRCAPRIPGAARRRRVRRYSAMTSQSRSRASAGPPAGRADRRAVPDRRTTRQHRRQHRRRRHAARRATTRQSSAPPISRSTKPRRSRRAAGAISNCGCRQGAAAPRTRAEPAPGARSRGVRTVLSAGAGDRDAEGPAFRGADPLAPTGQRPDLARLFIPIAEQNGLILPIGARILAPGLREAVSWPGAIGVAVNISAVQVAAGDLEADVAAALAESGLAAYRLELEITETTLLNASEKTLATLRRLKAIGVKIVMDDFGAGHSSLSYLRSFPFDKIKIDRAFARASIAR